MEEEHDSISEALLRKEKELQHIAKLRIAQLQEQLTLKDQYVGELQQRLKRICEDFNYNFQLIEERDRELHSFEQQVVALTSACKAKDADLSDLRRALQTKEDDYKADIEFLKQQLDDSQQCIEVMKGREAQLVQQEAEASLRMESAEKAVRDKERELAKAMSLLEAKTVSLENEREQVNERLEAEREKWERMLNMERDRLRDVIDEHSQCSSILKECEKRLKDETNNLQLLNASKDGQIEEGERRIKALEAEKTDLSREVQRMRKDRDSELNELRSRVVDEAELDRLKEQIRSLQETIAGNKNQKATLEDVIASLERELDLERKERSKDRRVIREAQMRMDSEAHFAVEKNTQWQAIAESRAEEVNTARRNLVQAEEQARHFEREFMRMKKTLELEVVKQQEESRRNAALQSQVATLERDKARLMAELRMVRVAETTTDSTVLRRDKTTSEFTLREKVEIDPRREMPKQLDKGLLSPSYQSPKPPVERFSARKEATLDTVPSRDSRLMVGLKQRIAQVKDQLETEFQGGKTVI